MKTRICTKCNKEQKLDNYTFTLLGKYQRKSMCKTCIKEINKTYYHKRKKDYLKDKEVTV